MTKTTFVPRPCTKCGVVKDSGGFYAAPRHADGYTRRCRKCINKRSAENQRRFRELNGYWQSTKSPSHARTDENRARERDEYARSTARRLAINRKARYGLTPDRFLELMDQQEQKCAICGTEITERLACVDHCHTTGAVRGLLCRSCNFGLGHFRDNPELLLAAVAYLRGY